MDLISRENLQNSIEKSLDNANLSEYEACVCVCDIYDKEIENAPTIAISALENSSQIIDALEKLKDETMDAIVKFGIEKSIECVKKILEENE